MEEACSFLWEFRLFWVLTMTPDKHRSELNQQPLALSGPQLLQFYLSLKAQYNHLKPTKRRETCHVGGEAHLWEWIECCKQNSCVCVLFFFYLFFFLNLCLYLVHMKKPKQMEFGGWTVSRKSLIPINACPWLQSFFNRRAKEIKNKVGKKKHAKPRVRLFSPLSAGDYE